MKHERIGSSTCGRVMACPASVGLSVGLPDTPSAYALEGTLLHAAMEMILDDQVREPTDVIGLHRDGITLTEQLFAECIEPALASFDEVVAGSPYVVERKVMLADDVGGTADFIYRRGDTFGVGDFKFGAGVSVSAERNPQGLFLLNGALLDDDLEDLTTDCVDYEVAIIAPRQMPSLQMWRTDRRTLQDFENQLMLAIRLADSENPPIASGPHCRWCRAKSLCPELTGIAQRALALPRVPPEQLSEWLGKLPQLEQWIEALRSDARRLIESGTGVPGWKLVPGRVTRKWADEEETERFLQEHFGLEREQLLDVKLRSPAQIEKVLKGEGVDASVIEPLVEKKPGSTTLVPESDPRAGVMATANLKALSARLKA